MDNCIQNFDRLNYNPVQNKHEKFSRRPNHLLHLQLDAFGMDFKLVLKKDRGVFITNHVSELSNGSLINLDLTFLYSGTVIGNATQLLPWIVDSGPTGYIPRINISTK